MRTRVIGNSRFSGALGEELLSIVISGAGPFTTASDIFDHELLVAPRFCDHRRKHSLAQPGLKRSLRIPQQL